MKVYTDDGYGNTKEIQFFNELENNKEKLTKKEKEIAYKNGMSFGEEQQLYWEEYKDKVFSASGGRRAGKTWEEYVRQVNVNLELQQRIDKAIEFIYENAYDEDKKCCVDDLWGEIPQLLEILKGEDK